MAMNDMSGSVLTKCSSASLFQLLDGDAVIGIDADFAGDLHCFFGDLAGAEIGVLHQGAGGGGGVTAAGADGGQGLVGVDHVAGAGDQERLALVGDEQQSLEVAQHLVGAPVLGQLDGGAVQVAGVLLELGFEAGEEPEGVGGGTREAGENLVLIEAADLFGGVLEHVIAEGDLAIGGHDDLAVAADANDGGGADAGTFGGGDLARVTQ